MSVWLGATHRRPAVEFVTDSGERLPLPLAAGDGALDSFLDRSGWVALHIGYDVIGLADGDLLRPSRLPDAWHVAPAADESLVLVRRYFGRSRGSEEPEVIELVDRHGTVLKSVTADAWGAVGELRGGWIATYRSLLSWEGHQQPLPAAGEAVAVLSGHHLVTIDRSRAHVHVVDLDTRMTTTSPIPPDVSWSTPVYDTNASQVALHAVGARRDLLVVGARGALLFDSGVGVEQVAWLDSDHVLASGRDTHRSVDVRTGESRPVTGLPPRSTPRVNVTGRFDPAQLREAVYPAWHGPIPEDIRMRAVRESRDAVAAALHGAGLPAELLHRFVPGVRLRSYVGEERAPLGASHFGGQPDLPGGHTWPLFQGQPMMFVAQLRTDEINATLPGTFATDDALVSVFATIESDGGYPVADDAVRTLVVSTDDLRRVPWPAGLPVEFRLTLALAVAEPMLTPPTDAEFADSGAFDDVLDALADSRPAHQMFGTANTIQDRTVPSGYRLLLQLDSDPLLGGPELGDSGRLLVWTPAPLAQASDLGPCIIELDSH